MAGPGPGPGPGPSSPPPSRRRGVVEAAAAAQVLPAFEAWRIDPTPVPAELLARDREQGAAFAVEFLNWLRDESAPLLTLKPGAAGALGGPASTTTPRFHQYMGPAATQSGASLRGGADAGRIRTSSLRRRPPAPLGSPQASSAQAASSAATGAAGLNPGPRHLFTDADFPVLGGGGAAAPPPPPRAAPTAAAAEPPQAKADGPSSPNPLLEGDGSDARGASTLGGLGTPLAYRRDSSEELLAVWTAPSSGVSTPVQQHQQQQQLKKAKRRIRPTPILSTTGGGGGGLASGGMGAIEPVLSGGMSGGGLGDGDLTRLPNAPPILLPPPRGSSLPASALRPPTAEGAAAGAGAATAPDGGGSSLSFLTPVKRSSNVGCVPRPSAGPLDGSGGERCLSRPRAVATVAVLRSPLPVGANTIGGAADAGADDSDSPLTVVTTTRLPEALRERIGVVAGVYATILTLRLAPKLATELHLLARLLTVDESLVRVTDFPPAAASLLSPPEHGTTDPAANAAAAAGPLASPSSTSPASPLLLLLLESGLACNHLAARTLEGIRPILLHLSPALLALFAAAAALRREAEALADEVQQRASEAQARLRFQDTSGLLQAGGGPGRGGDSSGGAGPGGLLLLTAESAALPFVEERDARHLYQGAAWSNELFNRQEEARDAFLKLLREFQEEKGQLDGRRVVAFLQALPTRAQDVLALLLPFSVPWFAELFAATLLRMGLGAAHEADDDILPSLSHRGSAATTTTAKSYRGAPQQAGGGRGVKGDGAAGGGRGRMGGDHHGSTSILPSSKKVQLLQDRLRSRGGPTQRASLGASSKRLVSRDGTSGGGGAAAAAAASGSAHHGAGGAAPAAAAAAAAGAAAGSHLPSPEIYFPGNQEFFYHFLRACDSYALNLALARVLGAELARTALGPVPGGAAAPAGGRRPASPVAGGAEQEEDEDGDDAGTSGHAAAGVGGQQLTDPVHLARLKLLARFLGLLMFSPNWSNALPQLALLDAKHPLRRALRDRMRAADRGTAPFFPCLELLRAGWATGRAVLVLPWVVEYLRMMRWDPISARTRYYQEVVSALRAVYWRLAAETDATEGSSLKPPAPAQGEGPSDDGRAGNALFLSFELEQLFEDLAVERTGPPPAESALLTDFPPFGATAAGSGGGGGGTGQGSPSSSLRVGLLDGEPLPLTERFLLLCSRPMHELAYLLKTALAAYQAAKAEGGWSGVGGPGGGHTPMKKVRPYRIAAPASSSISGALPASSSSTSAGAAGLASADGGGAGGSSSSSSSTNSALFSPGSASLRKIKPKVISQPQQGPAGAGPVPGALNGGGGGLQVSSSCGGSSSGSGSGSLTGLLSRLEAAFFQQHPHLHRCTELALQATLKNGLALARDRCVAPAVQAAVGRLLQQGSPPQLQSLDASTLARVMDEAQRQAAAHTRDFLRPFHEQRLGACLRALAEPSSPAAVTDVAVRMAVQHALGHGIEPVVEDVCLAVKRQVEAQRQAALKERARLLPSLAAATNTTADNGKKAATAAAAAAPGSSMSPAVRTQQALHHLRAGLEGSPLLTPDDVRVLASQAHGHVKGFVQQAAALTPAAGDDEEEVAALAITAHAFLAFALQAVAAAPPQVHEHCGRDGGESGIGQQEQEQEQFLRSLGAARAAVGELVGAMPSFWKRLAALEGSASGGVRALVADFCQTHARRLLRALLHWRGAAEEGGPHVGGSASAASWWLELMTANVLGPLQVEEAWLRLPAQELCCAGGPSLATAGVAARLIRGYHQTASGAAAGKRASGGSYHALHFSRLRAIVGKLDE